MARSKRSRLMVAPVRPPLPLSDEDRRLVAAYLAHELASRPTTDPDERAERRRVRSETEWSIDAMADVDDGDIERAWNVVRVLVEQATDDRALGYVAAGPLEDLLANHGSAARDMLIHTDRQDDRLRRALRMVWGV